ncbi:hypothetical protein J2Z48_001733 [Croceifilum oryzae]|uniref:Uncharacterized protein n=1 Tax=Croceifilum oryzae TaxID=1553429 RepID=A0AAJ1TEQ3_9BACL|nr:DUF6022 family protein [Croceifilum oryzae]MDQ0417560.1 hypothetical protein [Croceifilum oryzae]
MNKYDSLRDYLQDNSNIDIYIVATFINTYIQQNWKVAFDQNQDQLLNAYRQAGDKAYGTYLNLLFLSINKELKEAGIQSDTRLPGNLNISREWGNTEDYTDQERWMWSTLTSNKENKQIGTIVTKVYHDHTQLRVPQPPQVFAILESSQEDIVEALSKMSNHFKQSREFQVEYADYMKNNRS